MKQATLHLKNAFRAAAILAAVATLGADSQIHGKYCTATAPAGWRVTAENKQKVAFGADLLSGDGQAAAGYASFSAMNMAPDQAVAGHLTSFGRIPARFANKRQIGPNEFQVEWESAAAHGIAWYKIFPGAAGNVIVLRTANAAPQNWPPPKSRGHGGSAIAHLL